MFLLSPFPIISNASVRFYQQFWICARITLFSNLIMHKIKIMPFLQKNMFHILFKNLALGQHARIIQLFKKIVNDSRETNWNGTRIFASESAEPPLWKSALLAALIERGGDARRERVIAEIESDEGYTSVLCAARELRPGDEMLRARCGAGRCSGARDSKAAAGAGVCVRRRDSQSCAARRQGNLSADRPLKTLPLTLPPLSPWDTDQTITATASSYTQRQISPRLGARAPHADHSSRAP